MAVITTEYWPYVSGGAGISAGLLVRELRKRDLFVDVYVFQQQYASSESDHGSTKYYRVTNGDKMWPFLNLKVVSELWRQLNKYDVVHVYPNVMGALGFLRKSVLRTPVVATLNGEEGACINVERWVSDLDKGNCGNTQTIQCALMRSKRTEALSVPGPLLAGYFIAQRTCAKKLDRYFALSEVMKQIYVSHGFPNDRVRVVPNMFDPEFASRLQELRSQKKRDKTIILYVGRLEPQKGVASLVKAFSSLRPSSTELWIVGKGSDENRLRSMAQRSERRRDIRFLGNIRYDDLAPIYKNANIFVHTVSRDWIEPFGRTILEAMLAGLAIIASDGVSREILGHTGLIYHNESDLVKNLETLISDSARCRKLGEDANRKVREDFSPDAVCNRFIREYEELCS